MPADSIDSIKSRIIRNASRNWGYSDTQDINSFDPIVAMLIGALAEELHNISGEVQQSDTRVVEKMIDLLFKQNAFTHFPAHAIAFAKPIQSKVTINQNYQFTFDKTVKSNGNGDSSNEKKQVFFTPTGSFNLFKGNVKYMYAGGQLFQFFGQLKETIANSKKRQVHSHSKLYLGLDLDTLTNLLDGLSLLFIIKNKQEEERFYQLLSLAKWRLNGKEVEFKKGLSDAGQNTENSFLEMIRKENDLSFKTCKYVNELYGKYFVSLAHNNYKLKDFLNGNGIPHELKDTIPDKVVSTLPTNTVWLEIEFPQTVSADFINDLTVTLNCFPIINRELNESTHSLVEGINTIPLQTDNIFFDTNKVSDSKGTIYNPKDALKEDGTEDYNFIVRQGGIARFDSRDAKEMLKYLVDLTRNEGAAFAANGFDMISSELRQLDQVITRLQHRIDNSPTADDANSYILLHSNYSFERVYIEFWSTCGEFANNIRIGTNLDSFNGADLDSKSISLITKTSGGRQKLSKEDKLNKLRSSLLSKGRIVTQEDIKALCFEHFADELKKVEIKKGIQMHQSEKTGMVRTLDIYLFLKNKENENVQHKTEGLKARLKQGSLNLLPYRVFIK